MNVWMKLGVPVLLGAAAAGINYLVLASELQPYDYVRVSQDIKAGDLFKKDKLEKFTLRSSEGAGLLDDTVVKWSECAILFNAPCVRDLHKGDLVLWRDAPAARKEVSLKPNELALQIDLEHLKYEPSLLLVGNQMGFIIDRDDKQHSGVVEGPFRIVSVGRRVSVQAAGDAGDFASAKVVTIAIKTTKTDDDATVVEDQANRVIQARKKGTIAAIVLYPAKN